MKLLNAFSLQMLDSFPASVRFYEVKELPQNLESCVGHADTARVLGVEMHRVSITLHPGDVFYIAQLQGGRLPEGSTTLPDGYSFKFIRGMVKIRDVHITV